MDELSYDGAHGGDEKKAAAEEIDRLLAEETRRIQDDDSSKTQLLEDESIMLGAPSYASHLATSDEQASHGISDEQVDEVLDAKPRTGPAHFAPREEDETVLMVARDEKPARAIVVPEIDAEPADEPEPGPATELLSESATELIANPEPQPAFDPTVPGVIPVDPTVLRPMASQAGDEHLVVRNTRDYDHDAQSVNVVAGAGNFDTIVDRSSKRDVWRDPYARSSRTGEVPGEGNSRSKLRPLLAILVIALVLGGGGAVLSYGMELWGGKSVPYVIGESQATAEERLAEKGLVADIVAEPADDAIGKVLSQEPESGTRIPEGDKVTITVATNRTMPDVMGMSQEEAEKALRAAGAEHIDIVGKPSSEAEGSVLAQQPEAGAAFVSRGTVTLTVATHFTVPDVVGKKESDAVDVIKQAGLNVEVSYVVSKETVRTVVSTSPAAGETISEGGTVTVNVSSPYPTDIHHLAEFFDHSSQDVDSFLLSKGFAFDKGGIDSLSNAVQIYTSNDQGTITFSSQPYLRGLNLPTEGSSNVLSTGAPIAGVRLDCPSWMIPDGFDKKTLKTLAKSCGFKGMTATCSYANMTPPAGTPAITAKFACGSGRMGELAWSVLVVSNGGQSRAVATCAKRGLYLSSDLAPFGGDLCRYMAYQEVYLNPEYQVRIEQKDEKKDDKEGEDGHDESGTEEAHDDNADQSDGQEG